MLGSCRMSSMRITTGVPGFSRPEQWDVLGRVGGKLTEPSPVQLGLSVDSLPGPNSTFGHGRIFGRQITDKASLGIDTNWAFSGGIPSLTRLWPQHVRLTNYHQTLETGKLLNANPFAVEQAFRPATRKGGIILHRDGVGVIQVSAKADLVVFNEDSPNMLGWSDQIAVVVLHANSGVIEHVIVDREFRKRDFRLVDRGLLGWAQVRARFLEASRRIQRQVAKPPPMPERHWEIGEFEDVEAISTVRHSCGCGDL